MRSKIVLKDINIYAYHGALPEEKVIGTDFLVTVKITADLEKACESDVLNDTINYAAVNQIVHQVMKTPSKLLEHVAGRMIDAIASEFPKISKITVKITKINPPMEGQLAGVSVKVRKEL